MTHLSVPPLRVDEKKLGEFCQRWNIVSVALFGSALRDDFSAASDVDVLVSFVKDAAPDLFGFMDI